MPFQKGQSGNPAGRKVGTSDKRARFRKILEGYGETLVSKLVELALDGDPTALNFCVERLVPKPPADTVNFYLSLDNINDPKALLEMSGKALAAVMSGDLPSEQGKLITTMLQTHRDIACLVGLQNKLSLIEEKLAVKDNSQYS